MPEPLEALAAGAADEPFFLAWLLGASAHSEGLDETGLSASLGCPLKELVMLRLCRAPRTEPKDFWDDVTCIAERFGLDPARLAEIIKRGQVVRRFEQTAPSAGGSLMAARDGDSEPPTEPPEHSS